MINISDYLPDSYKKNSNDFSWPVSRDEIVIVRDRFIKNIMNITKSSSQEHHDLYRILCLLWVNQVIQSYHLLTAYDRLQQVNITPHLGGDTGFMQAVVEGTVPPLPSYLLQLEAGSGEFNIFLESVRNIKRFFSTSPLRHQSIPFLDFEKNTIVSSTGDLIFRHAEYTEDSIYYVPRSFWFKPIKPSDYSPKFDSDEFISLIKASFGGENHILFPTVECWLREIYQRSMRACYVHVNRILSQPTRIPKKLWIGSGGVTWDRMMKYVVKRTGGHVTGHDHGSGLGHFKSISRTLAECLDCDDFVPYSQNPDLFKKAIVSEFLWHRTPEIKTVPVDKLKYSPSCNITPPSSAKKVLIIPYGPDGNMPRFIVTPHDAVKVDFLIQIIKKLTKWGYSPSLKPHPDCPLPLSREYMKDTGLELKQGPIMDAFNEVDSILFMHQYTSTFREALQTAKPVTLIDSNYEQWTENALETLKKSCRVVPSTYTSKNTFTLNWELLRASLDNNSKVKDHSYYNAYYT